MPFEKCRLAGSAAAALNPATPTGTGRLIEPRLAYNLRKSRAAAFLNRRPSIGAPGVAAASSCLSQAAVLRLADFFTVFLTVFLAAFLFAAFWALRYASTFLAEWPAAATAAFSLAGVILNFFDQ
ncbi:hypothetical protein ABIB73_006074 [Bradyrhizobium sp. F1.4.3]